MQLLQHFYSSWLSLLVATILLANLNSLTVCAKTLKLHDSSFHPDISLHLTQIDAPLACVYRRSVVVNGSTPGPEIRLTEGKTTWIRVYNDMEAQNATVHWHGLSQSVAPFSDGTPRASQWPIPPKHFFDYEVKPKVGEAGTYFYHSHVGFQAVSAAGPLIVEEAGGKPSYEYDEERTFFITDLFNLTDPQIEKGLIANPFVWSGETEALLVNGRSTPALNGKQSQATNPDPPPRPGTPSCGAEVFHVEPGKTYRFRFVGASALSFVTLAMEDHDLQIIEADGTYTKPYKVDRLQLGTGQRLDVLLKTKTKKQLEKASKDTYLIQMEIRDRPVNLTSYSVLTYDKSYKSSDFKKPKKAPLELPMKTGGWAEYALQPLQPDNFPSAEEVTRRVYLRNDQFYSKPNSGGSSHWADDQHVWRASRPGKPYLVRIFEEGQKAIPSTEKAKKYGGWDPDTDTWPAEVGEVVEIILLNIANNDGGTNDVHPWHAHGGHYYDIGSGPGMYNQSRNEAKLKMLKETTGYVPARRDTTMLYKEDGGASATAPEGSVTGWRGWRLRVQDAGVWMIHCHTLQHMLMGLQTVWVMGNASQITAHGLDESKGYLTYGGNVYGNVSHHPNVVHHFD